MLEPLRQFYCDKCNKLIERPLDGSLEWSINEVKGRLRLGNFSIVHKYSSSTKSSCLDSSKDNKDLMGYMGENIGNILSFYDSGELINPIYEGPRPENLREFTEIAKRLSVPYYEEGRHYLKNATDDGYLTGNFYSITPSNLKFFIKRYSSSED